MFEIKKIPNGFIELLQTTATNLENYQKADLDEEILSNFCWCSLLGHTSKDAEVNYAFNILYNEGLFEKDIILEPDWEELVSETILDGISFAEDPNVNEKIAALKKIDTSELAVTLKDAIEIFERLDINKDRFDNITPKEEMELLLEIVYIPESYNRTNNNKIPNIGYTKAILWFHSCGIGLDLAPDNNHSIRFLNECKLTSGDTGQLIENFNFPIIISGMEATKNYIKKKASKTYFIAQISRSVFYYESTKSLISKKKHKERYSPLHLLKFLDVNDMSINQMRECLNDIEKVTSLQEALNDYISKK